MGESNWMIIKDSDNNVHRYSSKANWKSKRRNEILRQIFPGAAVAMAASQVSMLETGTEPMVSPVDGLYRGTVLPPVSSCHWPLMKLRIWIMVLPPNVFWGGVGMGPFWDLGP